MLLNIYEAQASPHNKELFSPRQNSADGENPWDSKTQPYVFSGSSRYGNELDGININKPGDFRGRENLAKERIKFRVTLAHRAHNSKHTRINLKTYNLDCADLITPLP